MIRQSRHHGVVYNDHIFVGSVGDVKYKSVLKVGYRADKLACAVQCHAMARMPNQIEGEHAGLLEQIARCRRLAREVHDQETTKRLLALAAEYEQKLNRPLQE